MSDVQKIKDSILLSELIAKDTKVKMKDKLTAIANYPFHEDKTASMSPELK